MAEQMNSKVTEEVDIINSIYEDAAVFEGMSRILKLKIPETSVKVTMWIPTAYPEEAPRIRGIVGLRDDKHAYSKFESAIQSSFSPGEVFLFTFIQEVTEMAKELEKVDADKLDPMEVPIKGSQHIAKWAVSEDIRDRGSVFTCRAIAANSEEEMKSLVADLLCDKKISQAAHNVVAWYICVDPETNTYAQDFDEDGETDAGPYILHVLQNMPDVQNVVVVMTRVFGGTLLGPDRFKHMVNCTRNALIELKNK